MKVAPFEAALQEEASSLWAAAGTKIPALNYATTQDGDVQAERTTPGMLPFLLCSPMSRSLLRSLRIQAHHMHAKRIEVISEIESGIEMLQNCSGMAEKLIDAGKLLLRKIELTASSPPLKGI